MLKLYYNLPNGKSFAHVSRSCTSTLAAHALANFYPDKYSEWKEGGGSPQKYMSEIWANRLAPHCLVMVRDPIERLTSLISRNGYHYDIVEAVLSACHRRAEINRDISRELTILTFHHIAPLSWIADNDSQFCLFPNIQQACEILDMPYDPEIKENVLKNPRIDDLPVDRFYNYLQDSIGIYKALNV